MEALLQEILTYINRLNIENMIDIGLVTAVLYSLLRLLRNTRAIQMLRGLLFVALLLLLLSTIDQFPALNFLIENLLPALIVAVPVLFQPELRRALEQLGQTSRYLRFFRRNVENAAVIAAKDASLRLSQRRYGALIVFEQDTGLQEYVDTGVLMDAQPSPELLLTIFNKHTELHDGAVIVRDQKLVAAACVLPLSNSNLSDRQLGLRHRAALGISEVSDAVAVVVSEETGQVSIAHNGRILRRQDISRLDTILHAFMQNPRRGRQPAP
ncbi:MAG: diadenylate cyclase CdaA [Chloroflexota bacterium]